jgi:hypothetical protein
MWFNTSRLKVLILYHLVVLAVSSAQIAETPVIVTPTTSSAAFSTMMTTTTKSYIQNCNKAGFDPWTLACSTCTILPISVQEACQKCCQKFKTLDSQAIRYQGAIVVDTGSSSALEEFFREDKDIVWKKKKGIKIKAMDYKKGGSGGGIFQLFSQQPSLILWYDNDPPSPETSSVEKLVDESVEMMTLDGLGRDDIREMLLALLPDQ